MNHIYRSGTAQSAHLLIVFSIVVIALTSSARATSLTPGNTVAPSAGAVGGTVIDSVTSPFTAGTFSGTLTSKVYENDPNNPLGGLTFTYELSNGAPLDGGHDLHRLAIEGYGFFGTDVFFIDDNSNVEPDSADRLLGDVIGFNFAVPPNALLMTVGVYTDCVPNQHGRTKSIISQGGPAEADSVAPLPEPSSVMSLMIGSIAIAARRRARS